MNQWIPGEAFRNIASGTTHALRYALTLAAMLSALVWAEIGSIDSVLARAQSYQDAGGSVLTVVAQGRVDGNACTALGRLPGVRSGALREEPAPISAAAIPRGPITTYDVTDGLLDVVDAHRDAGLGIAVSREIADNLSLSIGSGLTTSQGRTTRIRGVFEWPDDGRRSGYGYAALVPVNSDGAFDECWVRAWPRPTNLSTLLRSVVLPSENLQDKIVLTPLNTTLGTSFDGQSLYQERASRDAWIAALILGAALGFISVRTRRLELASAQHVGVGRREQHLQMLLESLSWTLAAGAVVAAVSALAIRHSSGIDNLALAASAAHITLPGLAAALLGTQAACAMTSEQHLFVYFKSR